MYLLLVLDYLGWCDFFNIKSQKVKIISRDPQEYAKDKLGNGSMPQHNNNKVLHPFQKEREYVRAINSAKYESFKI